MLTHGRKAETFDGGLVVSLGVSQRNFAGRQFSCGSPAKKLDIDSTQYIQD